MREPSPISSRNSSPDIQRRSSVASSISADSPNTPQMDFLKQHQSPQQQQQLQHHHQQETNVLTFYFLHDFLF